MLHLSRAEAEQRISKIEGLAADAKAKLDSIQTSQDHMLSGSLQGQYAHSYHGDATAQHEEFQRVQKSLDELVETARTNLREIAAHDDGSGG